MPIPDHIKSKVPLSALNLAGRLKLAGSALTPKFSPPNELPVQPAFILACGRSGNTLLRAMLSAGDEIIIPPESYVLPKTIKLYSMYKSLDWELLVDIIFAEFIGYKEFYTWEVDLHPAIGIAKQLPKKERNYASLINCIYTHYLNEKNPSAKLWGDKTPVNSFYSRSLFKFFPKARYIWLTRNPYAVSLSYEKSGLETLKDAATYWVEAEKEISKVYKKSPTSFIKLSYEDLVKNPEHELKRCCEHIGISFSANMLEYWKYSDTLGDTKHHNHHANTFKPLSTDRIDSWKSELTPEKKATIDQVINKYRENSI